MHYELHSECIIVIKLTTCDSGSGLGPFSVPKYRMIVTVEACCICDFPDCVNQDEDELCDYWRGIGECENNRDWMAQHCTRSCALCADGKLIMSSNHNHNHGHV